MNLLGRSTGRWETFKRIMASVVIASASAGASVMLAPVTAQAASACAPTNTPAIADNNPGWVDGVYASGGDNGFPTPPLDLDARGRALFQARGIGGELYHQPTAGPGDVFVTDLDPATGNP